MEKGKKAGGLWTKRKAPRPTSQDAERQIATCPYLNNPLRWAGVSLRIFGLTSFLLSHFGWLRTHLG